MPCWVGPSPLKQSALTHHVTCLHTRRLSYFSRVWLSMTPWTAALQAPLSLGFSRQESWSGLPCPAPGDLPDPGIKPALLYLLHWQAGSLALETSLHFTAIIKHLPQAWNLQWICQEPLGHTAGRQVHRTLLSCGSEARKRPANASWK